MNSTEDAVAVDPAYVAGLLDAVGRVRFDISDAQEGTYTVRPMLRVKPYQTQLRAAVLGEFFEERGYQYDFIQRDYGGPFFRLQQRSDLQDLRRVLQGHSAHLVRELAFVDGVFADEFDFEILRPRELYRFTVVRDELRYGWRPKGRFHVTPAEIAERHDIDTDGVTTPALPTGELSTDYTVEWVAGVFDGGCRYRPSVAESAEYSIGYAMHPVARLHLPGVSSNLVTNFLRFCDNYDLAYGDSSEANTLQVVFTGAANIRRVLDILFPRLLVLAEASEALVESVLPRFDEDVHHTKQGFYDLLRDFDAVSEASGGPFRQREYDPAYFADRWRDSLDLLEESTDAPTATDTEATWADELDDVTLSADDFSGPPGRYHTIVDRALRDAETVAKLKSLYEDRCQVCGTRLASDDGTGYSEVHHVRPLGGSHAGPDTPENMLVLCPNHHADFDNGVVRIDPDSLTIEHPYDQEVEGERLSVAPEHDLSEKQLRYHNRTICRLR